MAWNEAASWESQWWGNCTNTYGEETKQLLYAKKMGLSFYHNGKSPYNIDVSGKQMLDIGGGPTSLLLKCTGYKRAVVVDPLRIPQWVLGRYNEADIEFRRHKAEEYFGTDFDEAWIYNVLQHSENPQQIIRNAQRSSRIIRIFEWIDTPTNIGHIHTLTENNLNDWLGGYGKVEQVNGEGTCFGKAYYGIFPTA